MGVGRDAYYVLALNGHLIRFREDPPRNQVLMTGIVRFAAGNSGGLAIARDGALWWIDSPGATSRKLAKNVVSAAVGDGANYYISNSGSLFVKGKAHRGQ